MRVVYRGGPDNLVALARELRDEGLTVQFTSRTDLQEAQHLVVEIDIHDDDGTEHVSDAMKNAVRWVIANFGNEHRKATVTIADEGA